MERALLVAVRFHQGRYHGTGDWPPAPARLYQALMAGAALGATVPDAARDALEWLEQLPPPAVAAPRGAPGQGYTGFVPNNDLDAALSRKNASDIEDAVATVRVGKTVRPILFDDAAPVLYCWSFDGDDARATALCELAEHLYQLGRGVDMAWAQAAVLDAHEAQERLSEHGGIVYRPSTGDGAGNTLLCPQPGTGRSLAARFEGTRTRFRRGGSNRKSVRVFVQPAKPLLASVAYNAPPTQLVFALRGAEAWGDFAPRRLSEAAALVAAARDRAAARLCEAMPARADEIERYLVGRGATETDKAARVRIAPIPSIGHPHADMTIRRLAVRVPQTCPLRADDVAWAFAQVAWTDADGVILAELQPVDDDAMVERYERSGRCWRSVTPLALSTARRRRIDPARTRDEAKDAAERVREEARAVHAVRQALRHAEVGMSPSSVRVQREPFDSRGERAESFARGTRFPKEVLWHVSLTFAARLGGPLLLGDGRYLGLGLMQPVDPMPGVLAFAIEAGLAEHADSALVARAARRAMLARMQAALPRGQSVPRYVSGHEDDGRPARDGSHRHVAVVPDLPHGRLLFVAPNLLQRSGLKWREIAGDHARLEHALEGMNVLRAGFAGRLVLAPAVLDPDSDPLFAPSRVWESVSDYRVTRHRRRLADEEALKADAFAELARIGWPEPNVVEVLSVRRGPQGGLSGQLRLTFATAQAGPLAIGSTLHKGGGLFAGSHRRHSREA
ncbi:MAG: type I-U CRISPR-associated protein Cas5/Cas6 [Rhodospirillaceae bacterium]|nr:type I-U CRISPR-associated protein Cas5/Cas6 [Rhodospirillaceae bacterium]MYB13624.1 type I-U CRISPR-associated protein Cas5/Cas6 [Rhodospirillaceae bacterium]MYI50118.1 type I-U CRISPR-associated protein Cas5/Cas6 [Rhodospirillaceae bacterium]